MGPSPFFSRRRENTAFLCSLPKECGWIFDCRRALPGDFFRSDLKEPPALGKYGVSFHLLPHPPEFPLPLSFFLVERLLSFSLEIIVAEALCTPAAAEPWAHPLGALRDAILIPSPADL